MVGGLLVIVVLGIAVGALIIHWLNERVGDDHDTW